MSEPETDYVPPMAGDDWQPAGYVKPADDPGPVLHPHEGVDHLPEEES